jgi:hypothetical protein
MDDVSHLWMFGDAADWEERPRKFLADPAWHWLKSNLCALFQRAKHG